MYLKRILIKKNVIKKSNLNLENNKMRNGRLKDCKHLLLVAVPSCVSWSQSVAPAVWGVAVAKVLMAIRTLLWDLGASSGALNSCP